MKNRFLYLSLLLLLMSFSNTTLAQSKVVLEHVFDGYYYPYNFPLITEFDDEKCFYPAISIIDNNNVSFVTYNENYTIKDNFNVTFSFPRDYTPQSIGFSNILKLGDGTPFFIVTFKSETIPLGQDKHIIAQMFNARNGNFIYDLGTSKTGISPFLNVYLINGKPSILMMSSEYDSSSQKTSYKTYVYSLGKLEASIVETNANDNKNNQSIIVVDMGGRIISHPIPGQPFIEVFSDGSSKKAIIK